MQDMNCILYTKFKKIYQKKDKIFGNRNADKKKKSKVMIIDLEIVTGLLVLFVCLFVFESLLGF